MSKDRDDLRGISDERVAPGPEFAVSDEVWRAVKYVILRPASWLCCGLCRQGIVQTMWDHTSYATHDGEVDSLILMHMIQRHGWTRETVGDH